MMFHSGATQVTPNACISTCQFCSRNSPYLKKPMKPMLTATEITSQERRTARLLSRLAQIPRAMNQSTMVEDQSNRMNGGFQAA